MENFSGKVSTFFKNLSKLEYDQKYLQGPSFQNCLRFFDLSLELKKETERNLSQGWRHEDCWLVLSAKHEAEYQVFVTRSGMVTKWDIGNWVECQLSQNCIQVGRWISTKVGQFLNSDRVSKLEENQITVGKIVRIRDGCQ